MEAIYLSKRVAALILAFILAAVSLPILADEAEREVKVSEAAFGTPMIDGKIDSVWDKTNYNIIENVLGTQDTFYKGWFKVLWDTEKIYVLAKVYSETFNNIYRVFCR